MVVTSTLLLALAVAVNPVAALFKSSLTKRVSSSRSRSHIVEVEQDQQQAAYSTKVHKGIDSVADNQLYGYVANVSIGDPPTIYQLIVDTGSSNTWVGANQSYVRTNTSFETPYNVFVQYGKGNFSGTEYIDRVTIAPGLVVPSQSIGVANMSNDFSGLDGILGIGPTALTSGSLSPPINSTMLIATVPDNLFAWHLISEEVLGISFAPNTNPNGSTNGEITWGGVDDSKYTGDITYVPITETFPSNFYWGLNMSIIYGDKPIMQNRAGILDTGTTLFLMNNRSFDIYQNATGATMDNATSFLAITPDQYKNLQSLYFQLTGTDTVFELTKNAQIWPRALNDQINGTSDKIYLIVNSLGDLETPGLDFIFGQTCLERFYSVYDNGRRRVGLATTNYTYAIIN